MALKLKIPPASEPITLSEAKSYLRITDNDDDAFINALITDVRQKFEAWTSRSLISQTWTLWLDRFPEKEAANRPEGVFDFPVSFYNYTHRSIPVSRPPLQSISFLKTYAPDDAATTFDSSNYLVDNASVPGRISVNSDSVWPTHLRNTSAVEIEFISGYGDASQVPEPIKQGMLLWIKLLFADSSKLFESDESTRGLVEINRQSIPTPVQALWEPYRLVKI